MEPLITIYQDLRRAKPGKRYPIKIRVWDGLRKRAKLYSAKLDLTKRDFKGAWESQKVRKEFQQLRTKLDVIKAKAVKAASELSLFSFEAYEKKQNRKTGDGINIIYQYDKRAKELYAQDRIGSWRTYQLSINSITRFIKDQTGTEPKKILFQEITPEFLAGYEKYMVEKMENSLTTVGIYLRHLRAIFNKAISEKEIKADFYPFGKGKYVIPSVQGTKKVLNKNQLGILFKAKTKNLEQKKAKSFWFFSFGCNGMNLKDIAMLKFKDIEDGSVKFYRAKTMNTSKGNLKEITAYLNTYTKSVIKTYGASIKNPDDYVFGIISKNDSPEEQRRLIQNFIRFINQHMEKLCEDNKLPRTTLGIARHSFATSVIRNGASMEYLQEQLGHHNSATTQKYFAGFEDETKKEFAKTIMNFK